MRTPYQGVIQILRFNARFYGATLAGVLAAWTAAMLLPAAWRTALLMCSIPPFYWLCSSLAVSHYVYDRFPLYDFRWLARVLARPPCRWINIHAGLDETSPLLSDLFPASRGQILDIYDPHEMTEHSIEEARRLKTISPQAISAHWSRLPFPDHSVDTVFLIFSAHELRSPYTRVRLFRELARVLDHQGEVVLIEHSRDWRNFLAFGPGFLHFLSANAWRRTIREAGLPERMELSLTPFVHAYLLRKPA